MPDSVQTLVQEREQARSDKNWGKADELRDEILSLGFVLEDTREGTSISRA